ncbi:hypothetical protein TNCV_1746411 [Trichonephila clavipes]|nr:hypothetical protein TNCV_1746411 [Trichonephila clavipes]
MPSPVQSIVMLTTPLQTGSTVLSGQWDTHNRSACVVVLPSNVWQQFFGRFAFLRQQETDLPPAELWFVCSFLNDRTICLSSAGVVLLTTSPVPSTTHSSCFKCLPQP